IAEYQPHTVFHLAAQPLVRFSYEEPILTFETNVLGCANVLDISRRTPSAKALVVVTTDKVYLNRDPDKTFGEDDPLGGDDPYSASKAAQEMVAHSFRTSFFEKNGVGLATARAGNVIGGGDWAPDRLIPDCMRAFDQRKPATIRRPHSTRPWQHVLESLSGYLLLAEKLYEAPQTCSPAYNFAPPPTEALPVRDVAEVLAECWGKSAELRISENLEGPHEAPFLKLDASLAEKELQWRPRWPLKKTLQMTVDWYRIFYSKELSAQKLCLAQIDDYERS
ncbi:MAG TPA: CDP-glucose 4,6-dehydratase, partial [Terriglobia bacterium]|nr:CDP-glucose 4,6-dehydratase [Terriglobia bacterium]